jgi:CheY-like chemotaxis protein
MSPAKRDNDPRGQATSASPGATGPKKVLLVGGSFEQWWSLGAVLRQAGIELEPAPHPDDGSAVAARAVREAAVVVVDLSTDLEGGMKAVESCRAQAPLNPLIAVASNPSLELARRLRQASVFYLTLHPLDADELRNAVQSAFLAMGHERTAPSRCQTKKILLIDDDADFRASTQTLLEREGYTVCVAASGKEGLAKVVSERPDLVVLDIMMEHQWAGYEVNQAIKFQGSFDPVRNVPILMVSSVQTPPGDRFQMAGEAALVTPDSYLSKPLDIPTFLGAVRALLGGASEGEGQGKEAGAG